MTATHTPPFALKRRLAVLAAAGVCALALSACANKDAIDPLATSALPDDYRVNHPITIEDQIATLDIPVSVDNVHLPDGARSNIAAFARAFLVSRTAVIAVVAPSGSPNQVAAAGVAIEVERALADSGVDRRAISYRVYKAEKTWKAAPVRLAFNRIAAQTAPCGLWSDQLADSPANNHYGAFGCATQQNLAAMVENPLDLLYPRAMTPADAARRATILEKYRNGDATGAATPVGEGGTIAQGVGN